MTKYLTEAKLVDFCKLIYPDDELIFNRKIPNTSLNARPDIVNITKKLVIEFDGYQHYTKANIVIKDYEKSLYFKNLGYDIIRIPYFVQLSTEVIKFLFDIEMIWLQAYPHGFISQDCILPADFCSVGVNRYYFDLKRFGFIKGQIRKSLIDKSIKLGNSQLVFVTDSSSSII